MRELQKIAAVGTLMLALAGAAVAVAMPSPAMAAQCQNTEEYVTGVLDDYGVEYVILTGAEMQEFLYQLEPYLGGVPDGVTKVLVGHFEGQTGFGLMVDGCYSDPIFLPEGIGV